MEYKDRDCRQCGKTFSPNASRHFYCSDKCNVLARTLPPDSNGCLVCDSLSGDKGYAYIRSQRAHRIIWAAENGEIPNGMFVCHTCDNRQCVNPDHLFLGTPKDNMHDMIQKNRDKHPNGEDTHNAVLTEEQVICIIKDDRTAHAISKEYPVSPRTILAIKKNETWKHIPRD